MTKYIWHLENLPSVPSDIIEQEEDPEVEIILESETSLYGRVIRKIKIEYIEPAVDDLSQQEKHVVPIKPAKERK